MAREACARCGRVLKSGEERHVPGLVAGATAFAFALFHGGMWAKETIGKPFCPRCVRAIAALAALVSAGALAAAALGAALWIRGSIAPLAGRGPAEAADASRGRGWSVLKNGKVVAWIDDKPGPLISRAAPPPPGTPVPIHPFLTGSSNDAASEGDLREILDRSTSFRDYADRLRKAGYEVRPGR